MNLLISKEKIEIACLNLQSRFECQDLVGEFPELTRRDGWIFCKRARF